VKHQSRNQPGQTAATLVPIPFNLGGLECWSGSLESGKKALARSLETSVGRLGAAPFELLAQRGVRTSGSSAKETS
jgi:hypothetical protein